MRLNRALNRKLNANCMILYPTNANTGWMLSFIKCIYMDSDMEKDSDEYYPFHFYPYTIIYLLQHNYFICARLHVNKSGFKISKF